MADRIDCDSNYSYTNHSSINRLIKVQNQTFQQSDTHKTSDRLFGVAFWQDKMLNRIPEIVIAFDYTISPSKHFVNTFHIDRLFLFVLSQFSRWVQSASLSERQQSMRFSTRTKSVGHRPYVMHNIFSKYLLSDLLCSVHREISIKQQETCVIYGQRTAFDQMKPSTLWHFTIWPLQLLHYWLQCIPICGKMLIFVEKSNQLRIFTSNELCNCKTIPRNKQRQLSTNLPEFFNFEWINTTFLHWVCLCRLLLRRFHSTITLNGNRNEKNTTNALADSIVCGCSFFLFIYSMQWRLFLYCATLKQRGIE